MKNIFIYANFLLYLSGCTRDYTNEHKLCGNYFVAHHESAHGQSLILRTSPNMSFVIIEGDIVNVKGNCQYVFATQSNGNTSKLYYRIKMADKNTRYNDSAISEQAFYQALGEQKIDYDFSFKN